MNRGENTVYPKYNLNVLFGDLLPRHTTNVTKEYQVPEDISSTSHVLPTTPQPKIVQTKDEDTSVVHWTPFLKFGEI